MNRSMLKAQAKDRMANSRPDPKMVALVFAVILFLISFLSYKLVSEDMLEVYAQYFNPEEIQSVSIEEYINSFDFDAFEADLARQQPSNAETLLSNVLSVMSMIITAGMIIFSLNTLRGREASCWNLFDGFSIFGRLFVLDLLKGIFIVLWSFLFIFPGIIAYYRYSQATYLLIDHPEMSPMDCIRESSRIMNGHKWERFTLDLSFIGWLFLISFVSSLGAGYGIPFLGIFVGIWFYPLYYLMCAGYYRWLVGDDIPNNDGWVPEI